MSNPGAVRPFQDDPPADRAWQHRVQVAIGPHPDLPEGAKRAVETDYGMAGGVSVIEVRECFLWYFLKRFGLDGYNSTKSPQDQHIILLNRTEVMAALSGKEEA
jgi:hypothetical protein